MMLKSILQLPIFLGFESEVTTEDKSIWSDLRPTEVIHAITEVYSSYTLLDPLLTRELYGLIFALRVVCRQVVVVTIAIVPDSDYKWILSEIFSSSESQNLSKFESNTAIILHQYRKCRWIRILYNVALS